MVVALFVFLGTGEGVLCVLVMMTNNSYHPPLVAAYTFSRKAVASMRLAESADDLWRLFTALMHQWRTPGETGTVMPLRVACIPRRYLNPTVSSRRRRGRGMGMTLVIVMIEEVGVTREINEGLG